MTFDPVNFTVAAPLLALAAGALVILLLDLILPAKSIHGWWYVAGVGSAALAGYYLFTLWGEGLSGYGGAMHMDQLAVVFGAVLVGAVLLTVVLSMVRTELDKSGYLALVLWAAMGMLMMVSAGNMMTVFLGLELLSLALYVAVAFDPSHPNAREAALKYFVLGSVASAFILFGFALIYGVTGSMDLSAISKASMAGGELYYKAGMALALVGFAFKLALVPFHVWAPDVYQGAPTATTAFMAVGTKGAALAMLARFLMATVPAGSAAAAWLMPLSVMAALSMLWGATVGMWQNDLKRLMAYSGISHAGYLVMAIPALAADGLTAAAYYMAAYGFTAFGIFAVITLLEAGGEAGSDLATFEGLYYRHPGLAAAMSLLMFGLAGLPPTGGFLGKFLLAKAAVGAAGTMPANSWILLIGLIVSTGISAYVYLRVIGTMFKKSAQAAPVRREMAGASEESLPLSQTTVQYGAMAVIVIAVIGTLWLGLLPGLPLSALRIGL